MESGSSRGVADPAPAPLEVTVPGYDIAGVLAERPQLRILRARGPGGERVVLKIPRQEVASPDVRARLEHEFELLSRIRLPGVVRALDLRRDDRGPILALEDGGTSLDRRPPGARLPPQEVVDLGIGLAETLAGLQQLRIVHGDLTPAHVVHEPGRGARLIGFGRAGELEATMALQPARGLERDLAYVSPEQTGRVNRPVDFRTDFYSLGVILYELLTGRPPFSAADALGLVHCHIAAAPIPPHVVDPGIPEGLSRMVLKLMAKVAEDRYQSGLGLKADLERCRAALREHGGVAPFELGREDFPEQLEVPHRLFGREQELARLVAAFERARAGGRELVFVAGFAGVGKTSLVEELHPRVAAARGYLLEGKFDQLRRNVPYFAWSQAFAGLVRSLLTEGDAELEEWRGRLQRALGGLGRVVTDVVPGLDLVVGPQPEVPALDPAEAQNRLNYAFRRFVQAIAAPERPLVIFLDDLQWVDAGSLEALATLFEESTISHLMVVGAYRDSEVDALHPLSAHLERLRAASVPIERLSLSDLSVTTVEELVATTLRVSEDDGRPLARLLHAKTGGNPFFLLQTLGVLFARKALRPDARIRRWTWDLEALRGTEITDNVVSLVSRRIRGLPRPTQELLSLAACVGFAFDTPTLAIVAQRAEDAVRAGLRPAVREGVITPAEGRLRFVHDGVQQAAYALIPDAEKRRVHLELGRLLLAHAPACGPEEELFTVVDHLLVGAELLSTRRERLELAALCLRAGAKARASAAFTTAGGYFEAGVDMMDEAAWDTDHDLALALHSRAAEAASLAGDDARTEVLFAAVARHALAAVECVDVYESRMHRASARGDLERSLDLGLELLEKLGLRVPGHPTGEDVAKALAEAQAAQAGRSVEDLAALPRLTDPKKLAIARIRAKLGAVAFQVRPALSVVNILAQVSLLMREGYTVEAPYAYAGYGLVLCGALRDHETGYRFGKLALKLLEATGEPLYRARTFQVFATHILHYKEPVRAALPYLEGAIQSALEVGDLEYAGLCAGSYCGNALFAGVDLREFERTTDGYAALMRRIQVDVANRTMAPYRQVAKNLLAASGDPCRLRGEAFDEESALPEIARAGHALVLATFHVLKAMLCCLFRDDEQALASAAAAVGMSDVMLAMSVQHTAVFYDSLARVRVLPRRGPAEQPALLERVAAQQQLLKSLADAAPMNHLHRWHLVEAERLRLAGQPVAALDAYDRAVALAREHRYVHEEGLANELAAGFWLDLGKPHLARPYLVAARRCYAAWGAARKVRDLDERYPALLEGDAEVPQGGTPVERLDLATVLKATDVISSELVLERLLGNIVRIAMESAGARRGHLLLDRDGRWSVAARGEVEGGVEIPPGGGAEPDEAILRVARLVARTRERLVLDDAAAAGPHAGEPPAAGRRTRALVCAPLLSRGRLVGLLHLENDLVAGAFTPGRLTVLSLLAAQAAISIENAAHLERERTARQEAEFLAKAGALLARSLATEETLGELAKLTVEALCDWCVVDLAEGPLMRRLAGAHADPARQPILDELLRRHPPHRDAPEPIASVHRTGKPLLIREVRAEEVRGLCEGDEEARLIEALGCRSIVAVPLVARGAPVAVLTLVAGTPGRFGPSHLQLAQELAARAAIALENARLFREAREAEALESRANERLRAEIAEREQAQRERARAEQQLLQAQKMESIGMLAGGVAHDFNNLLTVILSGAEALRDELRAGALASPELVDEIGDAGGRARDLTRQLLAFARRQVIAPVPLDLNALVADCERLLRRVIGEDVELAVTLEPGLWPVRCDPAQLQQVILNLAVNARDAMPRGGRLAVATANVDVSPAEAAELPEMRPGPHVRLSLRDSGVGMTPEVQAHAFEPFYTTKPVGKGTGLGLATVYGIMRQSGGHVRLRSAPGEGTTFDLLFPRLTDVTATPAPPPAPVATTKGTETILVVEDDPHVRAVTTRSLAAAGYAVIEAANGDEALERAAGLPGRLHLVVTDVVLPGVDGRTLAERLRRARPELRVLYVSGHADEVVANRGILQPGIDLLQKPFTASSLLARVRSVLDS